MSMFSSMAVEAHSEKLLAIIEFMRKHGSSEKGILEAIEKELKDDLETAKAGYY